MAIRDDVLAAIGLLADPDLSEDDVIERLTERGCGLLQAELLLGFVPLAVGRVLMANLPGIPAQMPDSATFPDPAGDRVFKALLSDIAEFTEAFSIAEAAYEDETIPRETLANIALCGGEMKAIWNSVQAGKDLTTSRVGAPMFLALPEIAGFKEWYQSLDSAGS